MNEVAVTATGGVRVAGETAVGHVREHNEDAYVVDPARDLYAVFDGMGGAMAGDVAAQTARDTVQAFVAQRRGAEPKQLLDRALQHACGVVFAAGSAKPECAGMGTTAVACMIVEARTAVVAHAGDSRAYLLREGRLQQLTRDHTIVEDLVDKGLISPEEADRHPYKNVLSRNLGSKAETQVDVVEVPMKAGDRLLLCSDGLYGYASTESIQYLLGSGDDPQHVAHDLIELALRGGGGDNVTVIVIEMPPPAQSSTQVVRTRGAYGWWQRRDRFLQAARERGLARNPLVRGVAPDEAVEMVAGSLCQAVFHDLEKSTGVNVWTFTQNLAGGWFGRGGEWAPLRGMIDILVASARDVIDEIRGADGELGFLLEIAVSRALVVAELALGGLLAERVRQIDDELVTLQAAAHAAAMRTEIQERVEMDELDDDGGADDDSTSSRFNEQATQPYLRAVHPSAKAGGSVAGEAVHAVIDKTLVIARARTAPKATLVKHVLAALEAIANDRSGPYAGAGAAARELYGVRTVDDAGIMPLFDAIETARLLVATSVHQIAADDGAKARALAVLSIAHQRLAGATAGLVLEAVAPVRDRLREIQGATQTLRGEVKRAEQKRAALEQKLAESIDESVPWEKRGQTQW